MWRRAVRLVGVEDVDGSLPCAVDGSSVEHEVGAALVGGFVLLDDKGFVKTGRTCERVDATLGTTVPGVFAVGDARSGSVKRVGAAIGEGAMAVNQIHAYLSEVSAAH